MSAASADQKFDSSRVFVAEGEDIEWTEEADVLVIGAGAAGMCAALEANENGASVILIDRFAGGGATAFSGGVVYAGGTRFQKAAGIADNIEATYQYLLKEWGDTIPIADIRSYCEEMPGNVDWLAGHGVPFGSRVFAEKTVYPPDDYQLYYCGNEKMSGYKELAKPAARGHRTAGIGFSGNVFWASLSASLAKTSIRFLTHSPVTRLVVDEQGIVRGVEISHIPEPHQLAHQTLYAKVQPIRPFNGPKAEQAIAECRTLEEQVGVRRLIRARKGVVLSTGGFEYNLKMLKQHQPFFADNYKALMRIGSMGGDGSGIALGSALGGATRFMDKAFVGRTIAPPNALLKGVIVNAGASRFINEESYTGFLGEAIAKQPENGRAWLVVEGAAFREAIWQAVSGGFQLFKNIGIPALLNMLLGGTRRGRTIAALARKTGLDPDALAATINAYNDAIESGGEDAFRKSRHNCLPIRKGPFYAINISADNVYGFAIMFTTGGLATNAEGLVTREDGSVIDGLYAAGRAAAGVCATNYISGTSIGDCVFTGRRVGRNAALRQMTPPKA